jgi:hypothetical protein
LVFLVVPFLLVFPPISYMLSSSSPFVLQALHPEVCDMNKLPSTENNFVLTLMDTTAN